jgi:hypothetical protein
MRTHNKEINGVKVSAYNDSGSEWVVQCNGHTDRYDMRNWTMKAAIIFSIEMWG